ncbi:MAG: hypothetical protein ACHQF4_11100, partial [Sphingobacteriales bacterium]
MNRRHFLYLSGTSLASLLFVEHVDAFTTAHHLVHLPQKVFVKLDDGIHGLQSSDKQTWIYKDVMIKLHYNHGNLSVSVHSPTMALYNVQLQWAYVASSASIVLGDHWERTYGDVHFQSPLFSRKLPWYLIQHNGAATTCFGVKTGCNTICYWQVGNGKMQLTMDAC